MSYINYSIFIDLCRHLWSAK